MTATTGRTRRRWQAGVAAVLAALSAAAVAIVPGTGADAAGAMPAWWGYSRPATYVPVQTSLMVPTRDGTPLQCDLHQPGVAPGVVADGRFPGLVVELTPYLVFRPLYNIQAQWLTARGYNTIVCNVRGTGLSGGTWQGLSSEVENLDNYDLIEWLAAQPWSDGRIGQLGESYGGMTSYRVATLQPPHLVAIAPQQAAANVYRDVTYPGGIPSTPNGTLNNWPTLAAALSGGRIDPVKEYATAAAHPLMDGLWEQMAINNKYDRITVPVLALGGLDDSFFREAMVENYLGLKDRTWAIFGPWTHGSPVAWPSCAIAPAGVCNEHEMVPPGAVLAWFDRLVKQLPTAPMPSARLTVYEGPVGTGTGWHEYRGWNPARSDTISGSLNTDGSLDRKAGKKGTVSFTEPIDPALPGGAATFTSPKLPQDGVLGGYATVNLVATLSATDANFYVELLDVAPNGTETLVNDGFLRASHLRSDYTPTPVIPGRKTTYPIRVRPDNWRFAAGHRVRVRISGGRATMLVPAPLPVVVTVHTGKDGSSIEIPYLAA